MEPIAKNWVLSIEAEAYGTVRDNGKDAFDRTGGTPGFQPSIVDRSDYTKHNDYYSTRSKNTYFVLGQSAQFQYKKEQTSVQLGVQTQETLNETYTKSLGRETTTGKGEWLFDWSPYLSVRWTKKQSRVYLNYSGRSQRPSNTNLLPVLDISVPTRLRTGNIYLKSAYRHNASITASLNDPVQQRHVSLQVAGSMTMRPMVTASWFDADGIQYSIPVNSRKPSLSPNSYISFGIPLTKDKRLQLDGFIMLSYNRAVSYQNTRRIDGIDIDNFDYMQFMSWFWGDATGDQFYSGKSGFSESLTNSFMFSPEVFLEYKADAVTLEASYGTTMNASSYSLDPTANTRTWRHSVSADIEWVTPHEWELETSADYNFFNGYPEGYNDPYLRWSAGITKNIKAWAISFRVEDILNSTRTTRHITTENYVEDTMQNQLGRRFFISVKWNFGKLNATKSRNATNASFKMMY